MASDEPKNNYYYPDGLPLGPQARRAGWDFPVWCSKAVWREAVENTGIPSKKKGSIDGRVYQLLSSAHAGLAKKLATADDFLYFPFRHRYWSRAQKPGAKKPAYHKFGARLFLDPSTDAPWLYIFDERVDRIDTLKKGEPPSEQSGEAAPPSGEGSAESGSSEGVPPVAEADQQVRPDREGPDDDDR